MISLFLSYSHKDEAFKVALDNHLAQLKRNYNLNVWHDRKLTAGDVINDEIQRELKSSDIIILMISSDFLASAFCYDVEMAVAVERHRKGISIVIPVIVRPCDWHKAPFGHLLAAPRDGRPIAVWEDRDEALLDATNMISKAIEKHKKIPKNSHTITNSNLHKKTIDSELALIRNASFKNAREKSLCKSFVDKYSYDYLYQLSENDNVDAIMVLFYYLCHFDCDNEQALMRACIQRAYELQDIEGMVFWAEAHDGSRAPVDNEFAASLLKKAAASGHPVALLSLARKYRDGSLGFIKDTHKSIELYEKAIEKCSLEAAFELGELYNIYSDTVDRALPLIKKASAGGLIDAMIHEILFTSEALEGAHPICFGSPKLAKIFKKAELNDSEKNSLRKILNDEDLSRYNKIVIQRWI